jgi:hypothetical protein
VLGELLRRGLQDRCTALLRLAAGAHAAVQNMTGMKESSH